MKFPNLQWSQDTKGTDSLLLAKKKRGRVFFSSLDEGESVTIQAAVKDKSRDKCSI